MKFSDDRLASVLKMDEIDADGGRPTLLGLVLVTRVFERDWCRSIWIFVSRIDGKCVS